MELKITTGHFKDKREAIQEISDAGWWPVSWRDAPGEVNIQAPQGRGEARTALRQARLAGRDEVIRMLESAGATE